ncbi:2-pyrone-4,6-dicarboxylate hydrolase [Amylibacter ulvae]|uniref:2-pyrone-4,6-dicarboxylate hydrolase n=1 Tax=Paramylibacter ulvae TaxID=1651968 RepID=A0ABQ3CWM6_9RHOB|nr:amidohydrolase family protein [Amylibacter ulvae]GHA44751.1 2-pyrone-4,6-dicarboxylate hydrolase [Amylibacter ulvae]
MAMDIDWMAWHPDPKKPDFIPPVGAVDAHCHVFGPADKFPFAPTRKYTPCDASKEQLFALRHHLGFSRNVIVQASCHGQNNDALVDALEASNNSARGVAVVSPDISDAELRRLHAAGVRGVRFNFVKRLVDNTPRDVFMGIAERIAELGWHIIVYLESPDLPDLIPFLESLPTTVVFDHMARPDVSKGVDHPDFQRFVTLMENEKFWCKTTCPERLSIIGPDQDYADVVPFMKLLVEKYPDRVLWGTDWPHPNMKSHMPDDGALVDIVPMIATTPELQKKLLVDNPMALYWAD